eukprot:CAMPEP_0116918460 /NCGR_PEP_ID=MMETSP0467-20121206/19789_1 /TAXON_ID=283647 /ORGANISM="Mesodinium pulex, Strain SPMC105" /LENGTH=68 /DNA_ID=CAMNT_0004595823 /DNA_START=381 /DNA_END=587 /DNA_ORIENTATION=+
MTYYSDIHKYSKSAEKKTKKAKKLSDKLATVVEDAEAARTSYFAALDEARAVLNQLKQEGVCNNGTCL